MSARRSGPALLVGAVIGAVALAAASGAAGCTKAQVSYGGVSCAQGKLTIDQNRTATQYPDPALALQGYLADGTVPPIAKSGYEVSTRGMGTEEWVHKTNIRPTPRSASRRRADGGASPAQPPATAEITERLCARRGVADERVEFGATGLAESGLLTKAFGLSIGVAPRSPAFTPRPKCEQRLQPG